MLNYQNSLLDSDIVGLSIIYLSIIYFLALIACGISHKLFHFFLWQFISHMNESWPLAHSITWWLKESLILFGIDIGLTGS